jgi:hypothetical protein
MPRNTRECNKRKMKAVLNLADTIEEHLLEIWVCFPDEERYKKEREALELLGQLIGQFREITVQIDGMM